jgi:hypothetical protein
MLQQIADVITMCIANEYQQSPSDFTLHATGGSKGDSEGNEGSD